MWRSVDPAIPGMVHRRGTQPVLSELFGSHGVLFMSYLVYSLQIRCACRFIPDILSMMAVGWGQQSGRLLSFHLLRDPLQPHLMSRSVYRYEDNTYWSLLRMQQEHRTYLYSCLARSSLPEVGAVVLGLPPRRSVAMSSFPIPQLSGAMSAVAAPLSRRRASNQ